MQIGDGAGISVVVVVVVVVVVAMMSRLHSKCCCLLIEIKLKSTKLETEAAAAPTPCSSVFPSFFLSPPYQHFYSTNWINSPCSRRHCRAELPRGDLPYRQT